eukprot:CAMPEP_0183321048 /NCGR_PEP_ID=MMETSP0160_2-20130417/67944_1 /TAXON_ID=2839 ORGANISM="Odontella Sinensis, Strain Grunow 1884" /NCGR_SAMPLE_ID=MMETSP0160_2 /ASSEMBLY_ACC=CAM_ASM_000250 /LENGTH=48 /DNA_ID= /DNA_START= /DNA_END= /DNA_ORIENTATION=
MTCAQVRAADSRLVATFRAASFATTMCCTEEFVPCSFVAPRKSTPSSP